MIAASIPDFRELARRRLPHFLFEYIDGGSYSETTLKRNVEDLRDIALRQRVLRDVSGLDLSTELFGQKLRLPVALAPIGLAGMNARRGECQALRAAETAGIPFTLSTVSACSLSEVAKAATQPFWFQLYMTRDRGFVRELLQEAVELRCSTLVFTVDMPVPGSRYRDYHSGLAGAAGMTGAIRRTFQGAMKPRWAWDVGVMGRPHALGNVARKLEGKTGIEDFFAWMRENFDSSISWRDLDFIRSEWKGPLVIKGLLDAEDAVEAANLGADGIVVSNHGGRQLDGVPSTARALPAIANAVGNRLTVLADGGVRSGLDVVRLLALGAKGVLLGRAWVFALAANGQAGVEHMLRLIEAEMRVAMTLTGVKTISEIDSSILVKP
ncbi:MAG: alpha-hydroxy-acid oxidizing enzyme [Novosphingobium sp. 17-62-19]|uniref:FMN-dependent L-lactate dehydrogenase LldD n=1 Tax=Novosphingobium sp. 17-62-19 TaxID=1970406 RepID=UPI000BCAFB0E|nr:FMN-dependent L-lactate dehydrogenase LldD [Novosphingobium sp. 17-62-19]OYX93378.1 MAG: alpha-hydroxy-acid oxidizing enzyme [Novosphingobium sp. 35-62-5]OZA16753.1 MAG: alpha-hydroxy-acid oxidizing enzyme [Novosphingobium sp. 17-62-19]OZA70403.1 MAG: alpha-hydroxy-acid oxidizing enzyme [Sphingomonadales bacterium 39-62-4]HQS96739.1 FMN-dependent L-lactate dehydrogenase LldD [Novosphingobium sp.]